MDHVVVRLMLRSFTSRNTTLATLIHENSKYKNVTPKEVLGKFRSEGVTVVEPSAEVLQGFRDAAQRFYTLQDFGWSPDLYNTVKAAMK